MEPETESTLSSKDYDITRVKAIKALSALWDIAFPERSGERCQEWAENNHLCAIWDPDSLDDQQDAMPPGIWDLMLVLGVTPAELIEHCHANPKLFEGSTVETGAPHLSDLWVTRLMDRHGFLAPVAGRMGDLVRDAFRSGQEAIGLPKDDRGPYCPQLALPCDRMCQTICNRRTQKAAACRHTTADPTNLSLCKACGEPMPSEGES